MSEALFNFRDLGGHPVPGGVVRKDTLFRSNGLIALGEADRARLEGLSGLDLREPFQSAAEPCELPGPVTEYGLIGPEGIDESAWDLLVLFRILAFERGERVAQALRHVADAPDGPLVFFCVSGKDRTDLLAGILLAVLGVDDAAIAEDFNLTEGALTDEHIAKVRKYADEFDLTEEQIAAGLGAPVQVMLDFLAELRAEYGDVDAYLRAQGLEQDVLDRLRERFTDRAA